MNIFTVDRARVTLKTAQLCLHRFCEIFKGKYEKNDPYDEDIELSETISIAQFRDLALKRGLEIKQVRLDWQMLKNAISANPILLLLENKNLIVALQPDANSTDQIVTYDPLYLNGTEFFLPRQVLETSWDGNAIVVKRIPLIEDGRIRSFTSAFVVCAAVASVGLTIFYPRHAGEEHFVFPVMRTKVSSGALPSNTRAPTAIAPTSNIRTNVLIRRSEVPVSPDSEPAAPADAPAPAKTAEVDVLTPVAPNSEPAAAVVSAPAAVPVPARTPEADALTPVAPNSEPAAVVSTPAAAPAPARTPEADALAPLAPNSEPAAVGSTPAAAPDPARTLEADALTPVAPNPEPAAVVSTPAAAPAPARTPEADELTPVAPNSGLAAVVSTPATAPATARTPEPDALIPVTPNSEPAAVISTPAAAPATARTPEADALIPVAPTSEPAAVVSKTQGIAAPVSAPQTDTLTPTAASSPDVVEVPAAPKPSKSINSAEIVALLARGDALFGTGDLTSARLFYERAADAGYGQAALRLGESYDPAFLASNRIPDRGDTDLAARWYRRARELGVAVAESLLKALQR